MTALTVLTTAVIIACLFLAACVLFMEEKKRIHWILIALCVNICWWVLMAHQSYTADNQDEVHFWYRLASWGFSLFFSLNLHFYLELTGRGLGAAGMMLLYFPVPMVLLATYSSQSLFSGFIRHDRLWIFVPATDTPWFYLTLLYVLSYTIASMVLLIRWAKGRPGHKAMRQSRIILGFMGACLALCLATDIVLPLFPWYHLPPLGPEMLVIYFFGLWLAMVRYRFLETKPKIEVDEIMSSIQEMILFLDPGLRIIAANKKIGEMLLAASGSLEGREFSEVASLAGRENELAIVASGELASLECLVTYRRGDSTFITDSSFTAIRDRFGDLAGVLTISRTVQGAREFMEKYHITGRQVDIIVLTAMGLSNREIAARLCITERTVETHLTNIYNRLGVNSRIELLNLAMWYRVI